ncbi:DUF3857 domain-containing protein [Stakelama sp. CBK3Z-3]|uniref:DUF3857 domain-containing protein n=1 Tax=Stakelama flava TaxID=2860338 RepID=A0ABS6XNW4_9SPHN|nr:DUF3857 domain-containing protein [Stakelama flava]MBW4331836.1 DUF3857 domain-containing protein [Stakelama flava]
MIPRAFAASVVLLAPAVAHAGTTPLYKPAPDWVASAPPIDASDLDDSSPIFLRYDQQQRVEDGRVWTYSDNAIRIANGQMLAQAGTLTLPWQPDGGDLIIHGVEIIRGDQHIDLLAKGAKFTVLRREEALEQLQLNGILTATLQAEGLRVGDVLHVTASTTRKDPALQGNAQTLMPLMSLPMRARFGRAILSWPEGLDLRWKSYRDIDAQPVTKNGYRTLEIKLPLAKPDDMPADAPKRFQPLSLLEASTFDSWAQVSAVMAPLYATKGTIAPGSPLAAEVARIKAASSDPKTRAAMALRLVQDKVRYLFNGMDGGNYDPQSPSDTWRLRYGDCKAKTLLLLALLHELDIESQPVLASTELGDLVPERLPSAAAFNHVLVRAKVGGETLWLDGTKSGDRLVDIADTPDFGTVLPVQASGAALQKIDMRYPAQPDLKVDVTLDERAGLDFPALYDVAITFRGPTAELVSTAWSQGDDEQKRQLVNRSVGAAVGDSLLATKSLERPEGDAGTVILHAKGLAATGWEKQNDRYRMSLDHAVNEIDFDPDRAKQAWRKIPVQLKAPGGQVVRTRIELPAEAKGVTLEGDSKLPETLAGYRLKRDVNVSDGVLTIEDSVLSRGGEIAPDQFADVRAAVALAKSRMLEAVAPADYPAPWEMIRSGRKDGRFKPILDTYAKVIADNPDDASHYAARAHFLGAIYDWQGAIADLDHAIDLEPTSDRYLWRAGLLHTIGADDKALADAEAARKLDPGSTGVLAQLATLYAETGDPQKGLDLVSERIALGGDDRQPLMIVKSDLLSREGKAKEAIATIDTALDEHPGRPVLFNQRCWIKGTMNVELASALKDCTKSIELDDQPSAALDSRAMVYFRMGRMDDALADLNAALDIAPGRPASMFMRGIIHERMGDKKAAASDLAAARAAQPTIDKDYARYGIKP